MAKKKKQKRRQSIKSIKLAQNFLVHDLAQSPFRIFCELMDNIGEIEFSDIVTKTPLFDVIECKDGYLFFEDFAEVNQLKDRINIAIRRVDMSNIEIERRAWRYLINEIMSFNSIDPLLINRIKKEMPHHIQTYFYGNTLTIQTILDQKNILRHQYDYRLQKSNKLIAHQIPSFSELIRESRNDIK